MARISRVHNSRSLGVLPGQTEDESTLVAIAATLYSVPIHGPNKRGHFSSQIITTAGLTGSWQLWYSLVPHPELTTDADWVQDTTVTVIGSSLTFAGAAGNSICFGGNVLPEWYRWKWLHTSGAGTAQIFNRTDGDRG